MDSNIAYEVDEQFHTPCTALLLITMPSNFTPATLKFLRVLDRHNDRERFEPRSPVFEFRCPVHARLHADERGEDLQAAP